MSSDDYSGLEAYLADCRELVVGEIRRLFDHRDERRDVLYDLILDYPLREGKGLRPALSIAVCCGLGGTVEAILPTAATLELYHNAFLIHDDVEDESIMRRGAPTLHQERGVPIAVNVGDAMLCLSLQPLLDNTAVIGLGPALKILQAVARMTKESVEGQALELEWVASNRWDLDDDDYVEMVIQKTGWYSFITPLQVGAIAAGASTDKVASLARLGQLMGVAFQITDDVLNLAGEPEQYGKEIGGDLWEGKRTLLLLHAIRAASAEDRRRAIGVLAKARPSFDGESAPAPASAPRWLEGTVDELVAAGDLTPTGRSLLLARSDMERVDVKTMEDIQFLSRLVERHGSASRAREIAEGHARRAREQLDALSWLPPSRHRDVLGDVIDYIWARTR